MPFCIHAAVQDADYLDGGGHLPVKNDVAPGSVFAVSLSDVAAIRSPEWMSGQRMETLVQHREVFVPLRCSPFPLGIAADFFQVGLGGLGQVETAHQFGLSLSSSASNPLRE